MTNLLLIGLVLVLAIVAFIVTRAKATTASGRSSEPLHSLPRYYGLYGAICVALPATFLFLLWLIVSPLYLSNSFSSQITPDMVPDGGSTSLVMSDVSRIASGLKSASDSGLVALDDLNLETDLTLLGTTLETSGVIMGGALDPSLLMLAVDYTTASNSSHSLKILCVLGLALAGFAFAYMRIAPDFRARNRVEQVYLGVLMAAAALAILSTVGIVISMLFETLNFFELHSWKDFFFGLSWAPNFHGDSALSILPLLWGTIYISLVALLVAVPIGLFAAIYLSEYASNSVRSFAKPMLEVLAGIPTIVYGLFALITFGPFLREWFGEGGAFGVDWMGDARSVATAGIVMGIMLIPFVSSLSDDIINAVPQALRDGSYGLGATQSETVKQVVLPAALPGIVGAILLAASRAIGETMIVVLGAGAIARFAGNPLEALTTITTRIVSQLTGDGDFNSPETLVAFALGLTLFVLTLALNVLALYIVRKYREQYE